MLHFGRKLLSALTAATLSVALLQGMPTAQTVSAADNWKFDFGNGGTASGYTGVNASTGYNASRGYGFSSGCAVKDVSASGSNALSDAVQFTNATPNGNATFCADVSNGLYQVTVWLGNTTRTSVAAEGMLQLINLTGNNATDTFQIPVTDGQLNLCCVAGKEGYAFTLSALEITKISNSTVTNPTLWICGDSTVCNYYPLNSSAQAGWGQMLSSAVDTKQWQVRNMAASGQYAAGFLNAGQFAAIEKYGKAGDVYYISIGINDTNYSNADEYYNVVTDMTKRAAAKGMKVVLVKQQGRADDISRNPLLTGRWFGSTLDRIGAEQNVQVIDLFTLWQNYCLTIGQDAVYQLYMSGDKLHINRAGATILAKQVADATNWSGAGAVTTTTTQTEPPVVYLRGDLNNDRQVNGVDLSLAKGGLLRELQDAAAKKAADVNDDGVLSIADLVVMAQYLTRQILAWPVQTRYYAIDATIVNGISETTNAGYAGTAYLNLNNATDSSVTFTVNAQTAGNYYVCFRIANGSDVNRNMMLTVNNGTDRWLQDFLTTGAWTTWEFRGLVLPLKAGVNTIACQSNTDSGGPNFDYLTITPTDEPIAAVYTSETPPDQPPLTDNPVIYVASDSTAQSYNASYAPQQGWGYYLGDSFTSAVTVSNHSIAGRSSKSFYDNGRLTTILNSIKAGDYLLVCFGINDGAYNKPERYAPCCGFVDNPTEGSFEYYMTFYIKGALDKGATPILMSPTLSIKNQQQPFGAGYRNIDTACKQLAAKFNVPYFDLSQAMATSFNAISYQTAYGYYMGSTTDGGTDFTHFTETGAKAVAAIIANGIKGMNLPVSKQVK